MCRAARAEARLARCLLLVSSRSFLHFAASKVSSPQPLDSAIPDPVSLGAVFNVILRTCQYLTGYRETVLDCLNTDWGRFEADADSFSENLVKEKCSEISGRWELKMAVVRGGGCWGGSDGRGRRSRGSRGEGWWHGGTRWLSSDRVLKVFIGFVRSCTVRPSTAHYMLVIYF